MFQVLVGSARQPRMLTCNCESNYHFLVLVFQRQKEQQCALCAISTKACHTPKLSCQDVEARSPIFSQQQIKHFIFILLCWMNRWSCCSYQLAVSRHGQDWLLDGGDWVPRGRTYNAHAAFIHPSVRQHTAETYGVCALLLAY